MKRFEIKFNVEGQSGHRDVTINTDELDALSQTAWFREFIGLGTLAMNANNSNLQLQQLHQQVSELKNALQQARDAENAQQVRSQPQQMQAPQVRPQPRLDNQVQEALAPLQQQVQAPQQPPRQPQQPMRRPGFLDISPDVMSEAVWITLSEEQRSQWMRQWGINQ